MMEKSFDEWVAEALEASFSGWDFSWLAERWIISPLPWDYQQRVLAAFSGGDSLLDLSLIHISEPTRPY